MAFRNECIDASSDEAKEYRLDDVRRYFNRPLDTQYYWTIDRERRIFLMWMASDREEFADRQNFCLWWKGAVIPLELIKSGEDLSHTGWGLADQSFKVPDGIDATRDDVLRVLREALTTFKHAGILIEIPEHTATFLF